MVSLPVKNAIRVLIVEDHALVADSLRHLLEGEDDITVVGIASSMEMSDRSVRSEHPDVVLMDYQLPDGTGIDATRAILKVAPETKVIMVTGFAEEDVLVSAVEAGCSAFITKHEAAQQVIDAIRAVHADGSVIDPVLLRRLLTRIHRHEDVALPALTSRENEILEHLVEGLSTQDIADSLVLSVHTVRNHVQNILMKLGAHSKLEAAATAIRLGLVQPRRYPGA